MAPGLGAGTPKTIATAPTGRSGSPSSAGTRRPGANAIVHIVPGDRAPAATVYKLGAANQPLNVAPDSAGQRVVHRHRGHGGTALGRLGRHRRRDRSAAPDRRPRHRDRRRRPRTGDRPGDADRARPRRRSRRRSARPRSRPRRSPTRRSAATRSTPTRSASARREDNCSLVYLIQTHEYVTGFPNTHGYAAKAKKLTTIGTAEGDAQGRSEEEGHDQAQRQGQEAAEEDQEVQGDADRDSVASTAPSPSRSSRRT